MQITGQPIPQVKWTKNGEPLWDDARYKWDTDQAAGRYYLLIQNSTLHDEGTYR